MTSILIEACVESLPAALAAEAGGAGRVELCASLEVGGVTPSDSLIRECVARLSLPVFVLVRPRAGSFMLDGTELRGLISQVRHAAELGSAGIVAGAITAGRVVDQHAVEAIVSAAGSLPVTFHRAFDELPDQAAALDTLVELGVARVLTSGGAPTAIEGAGQIAALVRQSKGRIGILPGGTVRAGNAQALVEATGVRELHSRTPADARMVRALVDAASGRSAVN